MRDSSGVTRPKSGKNKGRYVLQPWVQHPSLCVCGWCKKTRTPDEWGKPLLQRRQRVSPFPDDWARSVAERIRLQDQLERELVEAVEQAERDKKPKGPQVSFGELCDAYRRHHEEQGKRLDRDRYTIDALERFFGDQRDPESITKVDWEAFRSKLRRGGSSTTPTAELGGSSVATNRREGVSVATIQRYRNTLLAIMNSGVRDELIPNHKLNSIRRERVPLPGQPKILTDVQRDVLLGEALDVYEARQAQAHVAIGEIAGRSGEHVSVMPLRGLVYVAYFTLMRPRNNYSLRWEELRLDVRGRKGSFRLTDHKNARKGVAAEGVLAPRLVEYLIGLMPSQNPTGLVHPNPETGKAYTNIRKQWAKLIEIANEKLSEEHQIKDFNFYNLRHTGASDLVASGADAVMVVKLMGDNSLSTVQKHYFNTTPDRMRAVMENMGQSKAGQEGASPKADSSSAGKQINPGAGDRSVSVN